MLLGESQQDVMYFVFAPDRYAKDDYAGMGSRWIAEDVAEILIVRQYDERSNRGNSKHVLVRGI